MTLGGSRLSLCPRGHGMTPSEKVCIVTRIMERRLDHVLLVMDRRIDRLDLLGQGVGLFRDAHKLIRVIGKAEGIRGDRRRRDRGQEGSSLQGGPVDAVASAAFADNGGTGQEGIDVSTSFWYGYLATRLARESRYPAQEKMPGTSFGGLPDDVVDFVLVRLGDDAEDGVHGRQLVPQVHDLVADPTDLLELLQQNLSDLAHDGMRRALHSGSMDSLVAWLDEESANGSGRLTRAN
ncbi:hypothetical protein TRIUR3_03613 [Triticum urartu]|uniref:Uncharacterized protein n=1 Tax=Triticum urartu TaxID=4572 RepID=M7ZEI5_TRIUA|nr:hypothetical protein TRIUR3_03613 [Triticum urartu]